MSIKNKIRTIQDIMRKDVGLDGDAQRLSQLVWMLFLKLYDDREKELEQNKNYVSPLPDFLRWRKWAGKKIGEDLIYFINKVLFERLRNLSNLKDEQEPKKIDERTIKIIREIFEDSSNQMKSGHLIEKVIEQVNKINFNSKNEYLEFNQVYENLLNSLQSAGNSGEYYTPRSVVKFMIDVINPQLEEKILDPACGTGGFLTFAVKHLMEQVKTKEDKINIKNFIYGVEKKPLPYQLCIINMIINGIDIPFNINRGNTLEQSVKEEFPEEEQVEIIITNPPFGGMEEEKIKKNFPDNFQTMETADLFLYYIIKKLKKDGRAGIVLPDGFLFGEGIKTKIKEELLNECNLHTIVRLPNGVFNPYTGIKTNLLFFTKGEPTKDVWFFEHPLPNNIKNYSRTNPLSDDEFTKHEKKWWNNRKESEYAWKVSIDDIKARNYNLDFKNEQNISKEPELNKSAIIQSLKDNNKRINEILELLS